MTALQATALERMLRDIAENDGLTDLNVCFDNTKDRGSFSCYAHRHGDVGIGMARTLAEAYREALADLKEAVA